MADQKNKQNQKYHKAAEELKKCKILSAGFKSRLVLVLLLIGRVGVAITCDQAFFFRRSAKEKQRETRRSVGGQSGFSQARKKYA